MTGEGMTDHVIKEAAESEASGRGGSGNGSQLSSSIQAEGCWSTHRGGADRGDPQRLTPKHLKARWFVLRVHFQKLVPISFWSSK